MDAREERPQEREGHEPVQHDDADDDEHIFPQPENDVDPFIGNDVGDEAEDADRRQPDDPFGHLQHRVVDAGKEIEHQVLMMVAQIEAGDGKEDRKDDDLHHRPLRQRREHVGRDEAEQHRVKRERLDLFCTGELDAFGADGGADACDVHDGDGEQDRKRGGEQIEPHGSRAHAFEVFQRSQPGDCDKNAGEYEGHDEHFEQRDEHLPDEALLQRQLRQQQTEKRTGDDAEEDEAVGRSHGVTDAAHADPFSSASAPL